MTAIDYILDIDLAPYINCIMVGHNNDRASNTQIPIYADGFPGIMFQKAENGFYWFPKGKELSQLFLYGQTIKPASLEVQGQYEYLIVQLYPFASRYLLNIDPRVLNDDCFDLLSLKHLKTEAVLQALLEAGSSKEKVDIITDLMRKLIQEHQVSDNDAIQKGVSIILSNKGQVRIQEVLDEVHMTERSFERHFKAYVGLPPKQFARIIQFQSSLNRLTDENYQKLTEVGYEGGFTDQSHFIRTFKQYTGQTPSFYLKSLKSA